MYNKDRDGGGVTTSDWLTTGTDMGRGGQTQVTDTGPGGQTRGGRDRHGAGGDRHR